MQKCVFLQSVWPCTHSGFTHNNVTVCAPARAAPEAVLSRFCLLDVSILNIWWFLALHLNLCMCVNFEEETNILFYFDFFFFFPAGLFKLIWKQSLEYFCVSFAGSKYSASIALFFPFFLEMFVQVDRPLWQIPLHCADAVDAFEASLLCSAKCYHLASSQASGAKEHNVGFCLWDSFFFLSHFYTSLYRTTC